MSNEVVMSLLPSPRAGNVWHEDPSQPLSFPTGVPSGPRNVISIVNETSIILEWNPPRETGGRDDVTYNIVCKKCRSDRRACSRCDDNVEFVPRQLGLTETRVFISSLWAHTPYTFEIQAVNGVSNKSPFPPQHVSVNITTNQAGESRGAGCDARVCACCLSPARFRWHQPFPALLQWEGGSGLKPGPSLRGRSTAGRGDGEEEGDGNFCFVLSV